MRRAAAAIHSCFSSSFVQESEEETRLNLEALLQCESLFEKVAAH